MTAHDRACALADGNGVDPVTRDEGQTRHRVQSPWPRQIVDLNLRVLAVEAQHPDLASSRDRIGEGGIDRGIGFKGF